MEKKEEIKKSAEVVNIEKRGKEGFREIKARNRYFYIFNRYGVILGTFLSIALIVNILILIFFLNQQVPPKYVPVDNEMRYFSPIPLNQHDKSDADIQTFTITTLKNLYAFDYINFNEQLLKNQNKFTSDGWLSFVTNIKKSFILDALQTNQWISSYKNTNLPKIMKKGVDEKGIAYWLVEMDGVNTFYGAQTRSDNIKARLKIERVSTLEKEEGIGIASIIVVNQR